MYDNTTGELLCREIPMYGGNNNFEPRFDEPGYLTIPPCLFGDENDGLSPPILVTGRTLKVIKEANSTYGHHGEMSWSQVFLTY